MRRVREALDSEARSPQAMEVKEDIAGPVAGHVAQDVIFEVFLYFIGGGGGDHFGRSFPGGWRDGRSRQ